MTNARGMHQEVQEKVAVQLAFQHCSFSSSNPPSYKEDVDKFLSCYESYMCEIDDWYAQHQK